MWRRNEDGHINLLLPSQCEPVHAALSSSDVTDLTEGVIVQ